MIMDGKEKNIPTKLRCLKFLVRCLDLFQPQNCLLYVQETEQGQLMLRDERPKEIPSHFPQGYHAICGLAYEGVQLMGALGQLDVIRLEEAVERAKELSFDECARFFVYYMRLLDRFGQDAFFRFWRDGGTLRVVRRMLEVLDTHDFTMADALAENPKAERQSRMTRLAEAVHALRVVQGDLTASLCDAIVCPADAQLSCSGGASAAVLKAGGASLSAQIGTYQSLVAQNENHRIRPGQVRLFPVKGGSLKAGHVVFTVGPRWKDGSNREECILTDCYLHAMNLVEREQCKSVAFSTIGTGTYGFPEERAAEIALRTILFQLCAKRPQRTIQSVELVCWNTKTFEIYRKTLTRMLLEMFLQWYSPEYMQACDLNACYMQLYFNCILALRDLRDPNFDYNSHLIKGKNDFITEADCSQWTYDQCLAYIIVLQRASYWSGGLSSPHFDQSVLGSVRRVLLRMRALNP